jgi:nitrite reductase/ring-hydroxylating ferredoxin subunit
MTELLYVGIALALSHVFYRYSYEAFVITALCSIIFIFVYHLKLKLSALFLVNRPVDMKSLPSRDDHDRRRGLTYPCNPISNTWYHICDSDELKDGRVLEIRAVGQTMAVWRTSEGKPICHDAFCPHLGANLAVGGKIIHDCIECPFHKWKFGSDGSVRTIPYAKDPSQCPKTPKLKTYPCVDWCGLVCIYFHADGADPEFQLPEWVPNQMKEENWAPHMKWDIGHLTLSPVDWVDQAGDHAHFHTLHNEFLIPYTVIAFPDWVKRLIPLGICHELCTYKGDDPEWIEKMKDIGFGSVDKYLIYFTDKAGLTWKGKVLETTKSETLEMYIGPAMMSFHIPFTIGTKN